MSVEKLSNLPVDIQTSVLSFLEHEDLASFSEVCSLTLSPLLPGHCISTIISIANHNGFSIPPSSSASPCPTSAFPQVSRGCRYVASADVLWNPFLERHFDGDERHFDMEFQIASSAFKFRTLAFSLCMMCRLRVGLRFVDQRADTQVSSWCELCGGMKDDALGFSEWM
jgi:hypothetical protein